MDLVTVLKDTQSYCQALEETVTPASVPSTFPVQLSVSCQAGPTLCAR